jgi:hypothetical protein
MAVLEGSASGRAGGSLGRLFVGRVRGKTAVRMFESERPARNVLEMQAGPFRSRGELALAVHWTEEGSTRTGPLEVYPLGPGRVSPALTLLVDAFYFHAEAAGGPSRLVVYAPEPDSLVILPQVYDWQADRLVPSTRGLKSLEERLLGEYEEVLSDYRASGGTGDAPLMVLDVALLKGRLLARRGDLRGAFLAFEELLGFVSGGREVDVSEEDVDSRRDVLERVAEARRRAAALFGIGAPTPSPSRR